MIGLVAIGLAYTPPRAPLLSQPLARQQRAERAATMALQTGLSRRACLLGASLALGSALQASADVPLDALLASPEESLVTALRAVRPRYDGCDSLIESRKYLKLWKVIILLIFKEMNH